MNIDMDDIHSKSFELMKMMRQNLLEPIITYKNQIFVLIEEFEIYNVCVLYAQNITPIIQDFLTEDTQVSPVQRFEILKDCLECSKNSYSAILKRMPTAIPLFEQSVQESVAELNHLKVIGANKRDVFDDAEYGPRARYLRSIQEYGGKPNIDINVLMHIQEQVVQHLINDARKIANTMHQSNGFVEVDTSVLENVSEKISLRRQNTMSAKTVVP